MHKFYFPQVISDTKLAGLVFILLAVNALIIIVWQAFDPYEVHMKNLTSSVSTRSRTETN
jgi:hypothetical protein